MEVNKIVKLWGDSHVVLLNSEDRSIINVKEGDVVTITKANNKDLITLNEKLTTNNKVKSN